MTDKLKTILERCECSVSLSINAHRDLYETVEKRLEWYGFHGCPPDISDEVREGILKTNNIIDLHFYPDTPIGFYWLVHYDLDACLDEALVCLEQNGV